MTLPNHTNIQISPIAILIGVALLVAVISLVIDYTPYGKVAQPSSTTGDRTLTAPPNNTISLLSSQIATSSSKTPEPKKPSPLPSLSPSPKPSPVPTKNSFDFIKERLAKAPSPIPSPAPSPQSIGSTTTTQPSPSPSPSPSPIPTFGSLTLAPASKTINQGCRYPLEILMDTGGFATDGSDAAITFDPTKIEVTAIIDGDYAEYLNNYYDNEDGEIFITGVARVQSPYNGHGSFATLNIRVLSDAPTGSTKMTFDYNPNDKQNITDSNMIIRDGTDVLGKVVDGSYVIGSGPCEY